VKKVTVYQVGLTRWDVLVQYSPLHEHHTKQFVTYHSTTGAARSNTPRNGRHLLNNDL